MPAKAGRPAGPPEPVQDLETLLALGKPRVRALIGSQVSKHRVVCGITRAQLASRAHVHPRQIARLEAGDLDPQFSTLLRVAKALGIRSLDELLTTLPLSGLELWDS